ncbi:MAG: hypothetical protein KA734_09360 [Fluviicola sp.]|nr:hypothetical protein [Fluviicola sp.]MBP6271450.1 hypothetical protein [Fluviicola sp.]
MKSFDLIPDESKIETLFIMESPYHEELDSGTPCVGETGKRMSKTILNEDFLSFGDLLKENNSKVLEFGIMNSFPFPLEIIDNLNDNQLLYKELKKLTWIKGTTNRDEFYKEHFNLLGDVEILEQQTGFKQRITQYFQQCPNLKNLVFCGFISQSVYLRLFNQSVISYNKLISKKTQTGKEINLLFVNHPSKRNLVWDFKIEILKKTNVKPPTKK